MGGFFGTVSKTECVTDLFYGTDYNSHLGTKRGGLATYAKGEGFMDRPHKSFSLGISSQGRRIYEVYP